MAVWVDASHYRLALGDVRTGVAGIAVCSATADVLATDELFVATSGAAEVAAVRLALAMVEFGELDVPLEVRTDCLAAARIVVPRRHLRVSVVHAPRHHNLAHNHAKRTARAALERALAGGYRAPDYD